MTGPEHWRAAERLLAHRPDADGRPGRNPPWPADVAQAQVHATLAVAAAVVDSTAWMRPEDRDDDTEGRYLRRLAETGRLQRISDEWDRATGRLENAPEVTR